MRSDVDLAVDVGAWGVIVELPSNENLIKIGYEWTREDVVKKGIDTCNYAKEKGLHTTFFLIDSSGAQPDFLESIIKEVIRETDIDSLAVVDTFGRLNPKGTAEFVKKAKEWSNVPIEIHVHNDFGLGLANSLAAVEAGAEVVHTNVLGLGERSGGVATEEAALALELIYGIDTGINLNRLKEVAQIFKTVSGVDLPGHKPVIGENSFAYEAGIAAMFSYRSFKQGFPLNVLPYLPEIVGGKFRIDLGKKAGRFNVLWHLEKNNLDASEDQIKKMVEIIKSKALEKKRKISEDELNDIYHSVL
jgi:isopropylmalate/homocitrate/citramalate synthase